MIAMKRSFTLLVSLALLVPALVQCSKYDDSWIRSKFSEIESKLATLENNVSSLNAYKSIVDNLQKGKMIDRIADNGDGSFSIWYVGESTPVVIKTAQGAKGEPGEPGAQGEPGITPDFKIEDGDWYVSYDKGTTWTKLGSASSSESLFFKDVRIDGDFLVLVLVDGTELRISLQEQQAPDEGFSGWLGKWWSIRGQYELEIIEKNGAPALLFSGRDQVPMEWVAASGKMLLKMPGDAVWASGDRADWVVLYDVSDKVVSVDAGTLLTTLSLSEDQNTVTLTTADAVYGYVHIQTYDYAQGKYVEDKDSLYLDNEVFTRKD